MLTDFVHVPTHSNSMLEAFTKGPQMLLPPSLLLLLFYKKKNLHRQNYQTFLSLISCFKRLRIRILQQNECNGTYFQKTLSILFSPLISLPILSDSFYTVNAQNLPEFKRICKGQKIICKVFRRKNIIDRFACQNKCLQITLERAKQVIFEIQKKIGIIVCRPLGR